MLDSEGIILNRHATEVFVDRGVDRWEALPEERGDAWYKKDFEAKLARAALSDWVGIRWQRTAKLRWRIQKVIHMEECDGCHVRRRVIARSAESQIRSSSRRLLELLSKK